MSGCIYYIHCNETGKGYVGQHCLPTPERRWKEHWEGMNHHDHLLYRAFKKYGQEAFTIETLCVVPLESLGQMEAYWAEQLETYSWDTPGGYNMIWCGGLSRLGIKHTLEALEKIGEASSKRFENIEVRYRLSDKMKKVLEDPNILQKMSEFQTKRFENPEEREKQSQIMKKILESPEAREKMSKVLKKALESPEAREKMRQVQLKRYDEHPEQRERMREATTQRYEDVEERKKQSNKVKALWADPIYREKMLEARRIAREKRKLELSK
jgi:group I intron endonuclease